MDVRLRKNEQFTIVQCKADNKPISISVARELSACIVPSFCGTWASEDSKKTDTVTVSLAPFTGRGLG